MDDLFQMFRQGAIAVAGTGRRGLGIGLGLVKAIVDQHGGRVRAESDGPGTGSRFIVELPVHAGATGADAGDVEARATDAGSRPAARVLVAVDDAETRALLAGSLGAKGCSVVATDTGQAMWSALCAGPIDAVIVNIDIGAAGQGAAGGELARRLREAAARADSAATPSAPARPILALTEAATGAAGQPSPAAGFDAYLAKPVDVAALQAALDDALAHAGRR